ncbi:formate dehydrogenase subunit delta [Rhizobium sp. CC-YZS058]|nr:formate dehydrogenase subunit delta [Rhizobium sp. CC-YZS058]MEA3536510.1 formate dehydrogenase subunit delta [Rhizobium sp. CC-YZS058]
MPMSLENPSAHTTEEKLVRMANQIATFFASQPAEIRVEGVATHINKFWETRMRRALFALAASGDVGLDPLVMAALPLIRRPATQVDGQGQTPIGTGTRPIAGTTGGEGQAAGESLSEPSIPEQH